MAIGTITFGGKATVASTTSSSVAVNISTSSTCELVVVGIAVTGTSALTTTVNFAGVAMTMVGSIVATSEGNVQLWYTTSNTNSRSNVTVQYSNKNGLANSCYVSWYNAPASLVLSDDENGFSTSGQAAQLNLLSGVNNGFVAVDIWHSGYSTTNGTTNNRTLLYQEDRGNLIAASQYGLDDGTSSYAMLHTTPSSDDWAMIAASWIDNSTSAFASVNTVLYSDVDSIDGVLKGNIGSVDDLLF